MYGAGLVVSIVLAMIYGIEKPMPRPIKRLKKVHQHVKNSMSKRRQQKQPQAPSDGA